mmetsp:Transcript_75727/g.222039  ORF Transcript_75727/g.222039 Transcript_75727/m.222039 type:complete len:208 (+) Transcript_75727:1457-2080(+)
MVSAKSRPNTGITAPEKAMARSAGRSRRRSSRWSRRRRQRPTFCSDVSFAFSAPFPALARQDDRGSFGSATGGAAEPATPSCCQVPRAVSSGNLSLRSGRPVPGCEGMDSLREQRQDPMEWPSSNSETPWSPEDMESMVFNTSRSLTLLTSFVSSSAKSQRGRRGTDTQPLCSAASSVAASCCSSGSSSSCMRGVSGWLNCIWTSLA